MKILYIITKSTAGGAQTHISQLSNYMKESGNEVFVMANPGGWLQREIEKLGIKFYPNQYLSNSLNPLEGYKAMKRIRETVGEIQPGLVSLHSSAAGFWGRLAIKGMVPTIFTAHGWGFTDGVPTYRKVIAEIAEKHVEKHTRKIICVSDYDKKIALDNLVAPKEKLITIHNGVEVEKYFSAKSNNQDKVNIVFVGRLDKQKDPETLLKAFSELPNVVKGISQIKIVGDGPKKQKLEHIIKENNLENNVQLLGNLPRQQVFKELEKADIFTLISHYEGFPRSILEAMCMGLPVIASDVGGVSEAVNFEIGKLIKRENKEELKETLEELIKKPETRKRKGDKARERVVEKFSLKDMFKKTEAVYDEVRKVELS